MFADGAGGRWRPVRCRSRKGAGDFRPTGNGGSPFRLFGGKPMNLEHAYQWRRRQGRTQAGPCRPAVERLEDRNAPGNMLDGLLLVALAGPISEPAATVIIADPDLPVG